MTDVKQKILDSSILRKIIRGYGNLTLAQREIKFKEFIFSPITNYKVITLKKIYLSLNLRSFCSGYSIIFNKFNRWFTARTVRIIKRYITSMCDFLLQILNPLKLFIFRKILKSQTNGIAFVIAKDVDDAIKNMANLFIENNKTQEFSFESWFLGRSSLVSLKHKGAEVSLKVHCDVVYVVKGDYWLDEEYEGVDKKYVMKKLLIKFLRLNKEDIVSKPLIVGSGGFCGG